jgi:hypothetical protein
MVVMVTMPQYRLLSMVKSANSVCRAAAAAAA